MWQFRRHEKGMTLLELLIVVAIIGVLAAISIVNYMVALDKSKQKKTMADMRSIAGAWEARATDRGGYSAAGATTEVFSWPSDDLTFPDMLALLQPTYIRPLARYDGWGNELAFAIEPATGGGQSSTYAIRSAGRDGIFSASYSEALTTRFECDLVFSNGAFVVSPKVN